jgi:aldose 1-epimerase
MWDTRAAVNVLLVTPTPRAEPTAPSGAQFELAFGDQRAVVVEVGAGLRAYSIAGVEALDGYGADEMSRSGRGQVLIPWPNRLDGGAYDFDGRQRQLALTEPEAGNAIHGLVRWVRWRAATHEPHRVVLEHVLHPQPGYPFSLAVTIEYALSERGLEVRTTAVNVGREPCPYGAGAHPYLKVGEAGVDRSCCARPRGPCSSRTNAASRSARGRSTGRSTTSGGRCRSARRSSTTASPTSSEEATASRSSSSTVRRPERGSRSGSTGSYGYLMLFTGDSRPDVARRSLAVEPMTCPPNAFRSGESLIRLEPGDTATGSWGIASTDADPHAGSASLRDQGVGDSMPR